jgi:hypothetical protein
MKKGLLGTTALVGATALLAGAAGAAEKPTAAISGGTNFQFYYVDSDMTGAITTSLTGTAPFSTATTGGDWQSHGWYFGVDSTEIVFNVSGTADNGLNYGYKVEIDVGQGNTNNADENRIQLSGSWGTLQLGDEDGAEDIMNYGGESLMSGTGGFDGDMGDVLQFTAGPTIAGDSSDATKISYFSPRMSGLQVGASLTPVLKMEGNAFKKDGKFENHIGVGVNYNGSFGDVTIKASGVYAMASLTGGGTTNDISAYSLGGIVGFGPFSIGGAWADNGDSGIAGTTESGYYNVAARFESGPFSVSAGYHVYTIEMAGGDIELKTISVGGDYSVAPGLSVYANLDLLDVEGAFKDPASTVFIAGASVSF